MWRRVRADAMRVAVPPGDPEAYRFLSEYRLTPLVVVEKRRTIWMLRPRAAVASASALEPYEPPGGRP